MGNRCLKSKSSGNSSQGLDKKIQQASNLNYISLRGLDLKSIPKKIQDLNIKTIDLGLNRIKVLSLFLQPMTNIQILILQKNLIHSVPALVSNSLKILNLNENQIYSIQALTLPSLTKLQLSNNFLQTLQEIKNCPQLEILQAENNKILEIPSCICSLTHLQRVNLASNEIKSLEIDWKPTSLTTLNLENNQVNQVPPKIFTNTALTHIRLIRNQVTPETFMRIPGIDSYLERRKAHMDKKLWEGIPATNYILEQVISLIVNEVHL